MQHTPDSTAAVRNVLLGLQRTRDFVVDVSTGLHIHVDVSAQWPGWKVVNESSLHSLPPHINPVSITRLLTLYEKERAPQLRDDMGVLLLHDLHAACTAAAGNRVPQGLCKRVKDTARALQHCFGTKGKGSEAVQCVMKAPEMVATWEAVWQAQHQQRGLLFQLYPVSWLLGQNASIIVHSAQDVLTHLVQGTRLPADLVLPDSLDMERQAGYATPMSGLIRHIMAAAQKNPVMWQSRSRFFEVIRGYRRKQQGALDADYEQGEEAWSNFFCREAVNLCPLARLGTVEFREHIGTVDADEVEAWTEYVVSVTRRAFRPPWHLQLDSGALVEYTGEHVPGPEWTVER